MVLITDQKITQPGNPTPGVEIGYAVSIENYIVWVNGLPNVKVNEIVMTEDGQSGLVTGIKDHLVEVLMLDDARIKPQQSFKRTGAQLSVPVGNFLIGRTINPLGLAIDGKGPFPKGETREIDQPAPGIKARELISQQFETGIPLVDMLAPLALGQRELLLGDPHSGKTGFLIDVVTAQKGKNITCVYAIIGKPINEVAKIVDILKTNKALDYTVVVATSSSELASLIYLTPYVSATIAEYFQQKGSDVLLILDDMGNHAKFYREISLLSGKPPGRESYPGDIFYQHAKLVERGGKFNKEHGGGSITILPVIETSQDDYTTFMSTNLMGMTDGHLLFSNTSYRTGQRPPIDIFLSVSRVGHQTQSLAQKALADRIKSLLSQASRLEAYSRLGSDISPQTQFILKQASQVKELLKQSPLTRIPISVQMILLGLIYTPFFSDKDVAFVQSNKYKLITFLTTKFDLKTFDTQVSRFKDDNQFIKTISTLIPTLEKVSSEAQK